MKIQINYLVLTVCLIGLVAVSCGRTTMTIGNAGQRSNNPQPQAYMNPRTGEIYPVTPSGILNTKTGQMYPMTPQGALDPQTGELYPITPGGILDPHTGELYPPAY